MHAERLAFTSHQAPQAGVSAVARLQRWRRLTQSLFFALFLLAPALNLLRFDLQNMQLWFLGMRWSLGIDALAQHQVTAMQAGLGLLWRAFLPGLLLVAVFMTVAYRYGRLYCGWLCPHFSVVEQLNQLLHRACGKFSVWERRPSPRPNVTPSARWWPVFGTACVLMGLTWAITLLSYGVAPATVWGGLLNGTLTPNQTRFLVVATMVLSAEFALARHLFCRFGCAVGLFQSLAWMANPRALVVAFDRDRARDCRTCGAESNAGGSACDTVCPMRLNPRNIKRKMFSCVQCAQCLKACDATQCAQGRSATLVWKVDAAALQETMRQRSSD